jgi:hypothetical protein
VEALDVLEDRIGELDAICNQHPVSASGDLTEAPLLAREPLAACG